MHRPIHRIAGALAAATLALTLAACADDAGAEPEASRDTASAADFPVTVESGGVETTIEQEPQRIVSLSPSATETLFGIGAGDRVVAADSYSTYPPEAPTTDLSGYEPNVEAIIAHEPDLVVAASDSNELVASLAKVGVPVLISDAPADLEDAYERMATLGVATGQVDETAEEVARIRNEIDATIDAAAKQPVRVLHELDATHYAASSWSFIGSVYAELGATNIADRADTARSGYPQLTEEAIVKADPQVIVISDSVDYDAADVAWRPGWQDVAAVRSDAVVALDEDVISRWGTRLPELVALLAGALEGATVPAGS
ncbi:MAG: ABC transporter substrate-binding protein [Nocardioides sp.]|nr:ABC transporter substrate-binding protein [Nocardioides sp.]